MLNLNKTENHIIETYTSLFENLSTACKNALVENLNKITSDKSKTDFFFNTFGAWESNKTAEEIIDELKSNRLSSVGALPQ